MKARIKATGEIVDIAEYSTIYAENYDTCFYPNELEFLDNSEDYWTRLEHQYAGMAMQGTLSDNVAMEQIVCNQEGMIAKIVANFAVTCAAALVEKLKEKQ
jgi:hypothetical protein